MEQTIQLSISGLQKTYKSGEGVRDINLEIRKGELISLLGPSGCGKTTVLRTIGGFLSPDSGEVRIENQSILHLPPEKRPTAMVFQSYNLWPHMTVYENLAFGLKLRKTSRSEIRQKVEQVLKLVRLPGMEKKYPSQLSGGQQQRVAVARALLLEPKVLLLDEPFSALDAKLRMEMREELREIQAAGNLTMVFVTHDQEEALSISDRIVVMNSGRIEQVASPQDIYDQPNTLFVAQFIGRMNFLRGQAVGDRINVQSFGFHNEKGLRGEVTVAVRPEDIVMLHDESAGMGGTIRQVMVLGHYAEISIETPAGLTKVFLPREEARSLSTGSAVRIGITRVTAYSQSS
ncbi:ABC transporter ATP-binding protein [Paenibacillus monticola]|uniref:Carnitine transport ATP-binding protein OpuCA n=1 Tax=Paenibacillus monticola TaxID=2666075 RepID=A0A7X2H160_9BACL|nr:ABC transporter ATP-binding protein [Paenibacillus monticola]MRN51662.1 ATP-binding cassette domain-containing protein [Paenibacillus monticola]